MLLLLLDQPRPVLPHRWGRVVQRVPPLLLLLGVRVLPPGVGHRGHAARGLAVRLLLLEERLLVAHWWLLLLLRGLPRVVISAQAATALEVLLLG